MSYRQPLFWKLLRLHVVLVLPVMAVVAAATCQALALSFWTTIACTSVLTVILLGAGIAVALVASRRIEADHQTVGQLLRLVADGDYSGRLPPDVRERVGGLAADLDRMTEHLRDRFADLQSHRDQLRAVLDGMVEGVIAVDDRQRVLLVNDAVCNMFGVEEAALLGRPVWEQIRHPKLQAWVSDAVSQSEPVGGEVRVLAPAQRVLMVRAVGLSRPQHQTGGAVVVVTDMSEVRRLENVRQEFVANASHELKTPLASIKACVETLLDGAMDDLEARQRFLTSINDQAERLDNLVRDMLALTRIETGESQRDVRPTPLESVVATCLVRHRQAAERKQMHVTADGSPSGVMLLADEESLEEIFDNLIDNAIKYTNDGGQVTVRWQVIGRDCAIDVEDTGIGIPQSHLTRIFERFYRVDRARSRELGGTGLGLSIVNHLVETLGGKISVTSRLGKGSKFTVQLPLA